jgi:hypothetical protein
VRFRRRSLLTLLIAAALLAAGAWLLRVRLLTWAGTALSVTDPVRPADAAIMTTEDPLASAVEISDLYAAGVVPRVAFLQAQPAVVNLELARRGVELPTLEDVLVQLGVPKPAIVSIPAGEGGTTDGTAALADWCAANRIGTVIVVSTASHSRRVKRALGRALRARGVQVRVLMHSSNYEDFSLSNWWQTRRSLRTGLVELEKLGVDLLAHPFE